MAAACRQGTVWRKKVKGADLVLGRRLIAKVRWHGAGAWYFYAYGYNSLTDGAGTFASVEEAKRECRDLVLGRKRGDR